MHNQGELIALDKNDKKVQGIRSLAARQHITCINAMTANATKLLNEGAAVRFAPQSFDRILLDAPCSGLGLRPRFTCSVPVAQLGEMASYQQKCTKRHLWCTRMRVMW
jgi:16S rRNA C967 or C1407 C5-methylase (RsmB/RsmF family)